jgi:hypothetical protein
MTLRGGDDGNPRFEWAAYCWAQNVETTGWFGEGFAIDNSFRIQLEEFYADAPVWPVPGGGGYNISLSHGSFEILIENGISILANKMMVTRSAGAGSVVAYNHMDDGFVGGQRAWLETGLNACHMVGSQHTLFEGNYAFNMDSDTTHGNAIYQTFFRSYAPDSIYLARKPAFINAGKGCTWPWVNPAGPSEVYVLPAKARYDAGTPFGQP